MKKDKDAVKRLQAEVERQERDAIARTLTSTEVEREWAAGVLKDVVLANLDGAKSGLNPFAAKVVVDAIKQHAKVLGYEMPVVKQIDHAVGGIVIHVTPEVARAFDDTSIVVEHGHGYRNGNGAAH